MSNETAELQYGFPIDHIFPIAAGEQDYFNYKPRSFDDAYSSYNLSEMEADHSLPVSHSHGLEVERLDNYLELQASCDYCSVQARPHPVESRTTSILEVSTQVFCCAGALVVLDVKLDVNRMELSVRARDPEQGPARDQQMGNAARVRTSSSVKVLKGMLGAAASDSTAHTRNLPDVPLGTTWDAEQALRTSQSGQDHPKWRKDREGTVAAEHVPTSITNSPADAVSKSFKLIRSAGSLRRQVKKLVEFVRKSASPASRTIDTRRVLVEGHINSGPSAPDKIGQKVIHREFVTPMVT